MGEQEEMDDDGPDDPVIDMMIDLISSLDPDSLGEDQQDLLGNILDELGLVDGDEGDDELEESKIQKISRKEHLGLKKDYRRNKAKLLRISKMFRKTAAFKLWVKKHKRMVRAGKTKHKKYV